MFFLSSIMDFTKYILLLLVLLCYSLCYFHTSLNCRDVNIFPLTITCRIPFFPWQVKCTFSSKGAENAAPFDQQLRSSYGNTLPIQSKKLWLKIPSSTPDPPWANCYTVLTSCISSATRLSLTYAVCV